ncbi:diacylglycerol kinase family enzyme [Rhodococcus sp. OK519]|uniref:diacylglycerol/lipid kinase family protein n=1 Tax=Rhodococcus sp. OK519 TaxID=2135729 RepID=UPI000D3C0FA1|nr:diacylglycerol kinase family enzyme [Rhodococcus sp. OK519]
MADGTRQRWWARSGFAVGVCAVVAPIVFAGLLSTVALLVVAVGGVVVTVAAAYWFLSSRGAVRGCSAGLAVLAPVVVLVLFVRAGLLWVVVLTCALLAVAIFCAHRALAAASTTPPAPEIPARPPRRPFLVMNPHSGGGKVAKFDLHRKAEALGAEVVLLDGPETIDVVALARDAVARGADLLGVAGGDGTQALVAAVAAEHGLPFLVISAGTRNHFALDLGLDRDDPATCLGALRDGVDVWVDLGMMNDRPFVNNASFGVYAELVQSPAYRDDKTGTVLQMLPDLLGAQRDSGLVVTIDGVTVRGPQAVLVSNGPYRTSDLVGLGRRERLDAGVLGVVTVSVNSARQAVGLLQGGHARGLTTSRTTEVVVDSVRPLIPVGVDGESLMVETPVRCTVMPAALRVRVPRVRPDLRAPQQGLDLARLYRLAR